MGLWDTLRQRSHTPYSALPDVCIAVGSDGRWHPGVRIENASFPLTITAAQSAVFGCLSEGGDPIALLVPPGIAVEPLYDLGYPVQTVEEPNGRFTDIRLDIRDPETTFRLLKDRAIVPNSRFPVVALLETSTGWISGVNIEFADWQAGLCGERVALAKALSHGLGVPVTWKIRAFKGDFISPCGACRQVMAEFGTSAPVHLHHPDGSISHHHVGQFLPLSFNGRHLRT